MKNIDVVNAILNYNPRLPDDLEAITCDTFKCGDPQTECTGIVTTSVPSVDVIRKAHSAGANLIICGEPAFYNHMDTVPWGEDNEVYQTKKRLLEETGITIWRNHDHVHAHKPDLISYGVMMELGWQDYVVEDEDNPHIFRLPKTMVRELAAYIKEKMGLETLRVIGNTEAEVSTVWFSGNIMVSGPGDEEKPINEAIEKGVDVLIPAELCDWTVPPYFRDAGQLGMNKVIFNVGHMTVNELGMKYAANWIGDLISHAVPVQFIRSADMYQYL